MNLKNWWTHIYLEKLNQLLNISFSEKRWMLLLKEKLTSGYLKTSISLDPSSPKSNMLYLLKMKLPRPDTSALGTVISSQGTRKSRQRGLPWSLLKGSTLIESFTISLSCFSPPPQPTRDMLHSGIMGSEVGCKFFLCCVQYYSCQWSQTQKTSHKHTQQMRFPLLHNRKLPHTRRPQNAFVGNTHHGYFLVKDEH